MTFNNKNYNNILEDIKKNQQIGQFSQIIAVSKEKPTNDINEAISCGVKHFGENRVQEASNKFIDIKKSNYNVKLHLLGPLQTNKVGKALEVFDYFHTLDREKLATELVKDKYRQLTSKKQFFIQINTGDEVQKFGISPKNADEFISFCTKDIFLNVVGLMCIPPISEDPKSHFIFLKKLATKHELKHLSMGMSHDYITALQEGATFIRVGTLIFGKR